MMVRHSLASSISSDQTVSVCSFMRSIASLRFDSCLEQGFPALLVVFEIKARIGRLSHFSAEFGWYFPRRLPE